MLPRILFVYFFALAVPVHVCSQNHWCGEPIRLLSAYLEAQTQQQNTGVSDYNEVPSWAKREFDYAANQVYAAALKSIQQQKHEVQSKNENIYTVDFHVGITAWSWGYNIRLVVTPVDEHHSKVIIGVLRSGGKVFSWGSGKKEVRKIIAGIDAELISAKANS